MADKLKIKYISASDIKAHPQNFRRHPDDQRQAVSDSIDEFGFVMPAILNERTGRLLDGHLRRDIMQEHPDEQLPVVTVDWTEDKERRFLASFDRTTNMAIEDEGALSDLLKSIEDVSTLPAYDEDALKSLMRESPVLDLGEKEQTEDFADGEQFNIPPVATVKIRVERERVETEEFKEALKAFCDEHNCLQYRIG